MKASWKFSLALLFLLPLPAPAFPTHNSRGHNCVGCVLVVSIIEQLAQVHNSTVQAAMERLCSYLPEKLFLKTSCYLVVHTFGLDIIKLLSANVNADVVCHSLEFCQQDTGQPLCHLYPSPKATWKFTLEKARQIVEKSQTVKYLRSGSDICSLPFLAKICQKIKFTLKNAVPFKDVDSDKYSVSPTLRGYHWRGRDCNDRNKTVYPGRRPDSWDAHQDSNCNGIWGIDPKDGIPYEKKFCEGSQPRGIILLGDSAGAHFSISPEWITASQMSLNAFVNLPTALTNELNWPQLSGTTGFLDSTSGIKEKSIYLRLRKRNHCNHRDYQNISKNGASSQNLEKFIKSLSRNQLLDYPAIVIYAMIGNDVCNGRNDPVPDMTTPEKFYSKVMQTLKYLNSQLPNGSHVILYGLADGAFLWDNLHNRYHPLGQLNKDVTYAQFYSFLSCLQVSPCHGWMSSNKTLRMLTSERAEQLSNTLRKIATSEKFTNFNLFYMDFAFQEITEEWQKRGGQPWQLVEPVDGFHPNEVSLLLFADNFWKKVNHQWPQILGKENPFNPQIEQVFGDQGGTEPLGNTHSWRAQGGRNSGKSINSVNRWLWGMLCHGPVEPSVAESFQNTLLGEEYIERTVLLCASQIIFPIFLQPSLK